MLSSVHEINSQTWDRKTTCVHFYINSSPQNYLFFSLIPSLSIFCCVCKICQSCTPDPWETTFTRQDQPPPLLRSLSYIGLLLTLYFGPIHYTPRGCELHKNNDARSTNSHLYLYIAWYNTEGTCIRVWLNTLVAKICSQRRQRLQVPVINAVT